MKIAYFIIGVLLLTQSGMASVPVDESSSPMEAIMNEDLIRALRDPFEVPALIKQVKTKPESDLEMYQLRDFKLNGVITGPKKTRAMVTSPKGKTYFVKVGDSLGAREGRVTRITPDTVRVVEFYVDEKGKRLPDTYDLKISGELEVLNKKSGD